jgi:hypothetical protein
MCVKSANAVKLNSLLLALLLFSISKAFATTPPDYLELTSAEINNRKFKFDIRKIDTRSSIELNFPKQVFVNGFWLAPDSTYVKIKNKAGKEIGWTINYIKGSAAHSIITSYNHDVSDLSVSITYRCEHPSGCFGSATFGISSISSFIEANPDADGLQPKCHQITGQMIEIVNCKELKKR